MTKDLKYPEEIKEEQFKKLLEDYESKEYDRLSKKEDYCECHERCPKCGRKYKPSQWNGEYTLCR